MALDQGTVIKWREKWKDRFSEYMSKSKTEHDPIPDDITCEVAEVRAAELLHPKLGRMSWAAWSELLLLALSDKDPKAPDYVPLWMAVPALKELRMGASLRNFLDQAEQDLQSAFSQRGRYYKEEMEQVESWLRDLPESRLDPRRPVGFCLAMAGPSSRMMGWKLNADYAGLVVPRAKLDEPDDWSPALERVHNMLPPKPPDARDPIVLVEVRDQPPDPRPADVQPLADLPRYYVVLSPGDSPERPDVVPDPSTFWQAMDFALRVP